MARREIIVLQDDMDDSEDTTVRMYRFAFEGTNYEIDLNGDNGAELLKALQPYINAGRVVRPNKVQPRQQSGMSAADKKRQNEVIRGWAKSQSMSVSERGRVAKKVLEAWMAAGQPKGPFASPAPKQAIKKAAPTAIPAPRFESAAPQSMIEKAGVRNGGEAGTKRTARKAAAKAAPPAEEVKAA